LTINASRHSEPSVVELICSAAIFRANWFDTQQIGTLAGSRFTVRRNRNHDVIIDRDIRVAQADIMATNGVIHVVDDVISDRKTKATWFDGPVGDWLFDFK